MGSLVPASSLKNKNSRDCTPLNMVRCHYGLTSRTSFFVEGFSAQEIMAYNLFLFQKIVRIALQGKYFQSIPFTRCRFQSIFMLEDWVWDAG